MKIAKIPRLKLLTFDATSCIDEFDVGKVTYHKDGRVRMANALLVNSLRALASRR